MILLFFAFSWTLSAKEIPLIHQCKERSSLGEEFIECSYSVKSDIRFDLMISKKTGRHTLTILKQADYDNKKTRYFLKGGNYQHSCLIISATDPSVFSAAFISTKDGSVIKDWSDKKCEL